MPAFFSPPDGPPALTVEPELIDRQSSWREFDEAGRQWLAETGRLTGAGLGLRHTASWGRVSGAIQRVSGVRAYRGQTNSGTPVTTSADLRESALHGQGWARLGAGWELGVEWRQDRIQRHLRDAGNAAGYTEWWRRDAVRPRLGWAGGLAAGEFMLQAGADILSRTTVQLTLPGRDTVELAPAGGRGADCSVGYRYRFGHSPAWRAAWSVQWRETRLSWAASPLVPVFSAGLLRGGAFQPASRSSSRDIVMGFTLDWY